MKFTVRLLTMFGVFLLVAGTIYMLIGPPIGPIGGILLFANAIFFFFIAIMVKSAPAMDYMRDHREVAVDRTQISEATKEKLALPPPPAGIHIPGPSAWPIALAVSAALVALGLVFTAFKVNFFITLGAAFLIVTAAGWAVQAWNEREEIVEHEEHADAEHAPH